MSGDKMKKVCIDVPTGYLIFFCLLLILSFACMIFGVGFAIAYTSSIDPEYINVNCQDVKLDNRYIVEGEIKCIEEVIDINHFDKSFVFMYVSGIIFVFSLLSLGFVDSLKDNVRKVLKEEKIEVQYV